MSLIECRLATGDEDFDGGLGRVDRLRFFSDHGVLGSYSASWACWLGAWLMFCEAVQKSRYGKFRPRGPLGCVVGKSDKWPQAQISRNGVLGKLCSKRAERAPFCRHCTNDKDQRFGNRTSKALNRSNSSPRESNTETNACTFRL